MISDSVLRLINDSLEGIGISSSQRDNIIHQIKMEATKQNLHHINRITKVELIDKIKGMKSAPLLTKRIISLLG
ncbi:MAG: hypothetical protein EAX90_15515 [Candidatus Heimdallarchaeota archaeon]|nr:hypothetical protein [Candidatus Heimdallarchaeota archaeon]